MDNRKQQKAPLTRSEIMSRIRSRDTQLEIVLRRLLHAAGVRYRVHCMVNRICRADVAFLGPKLAVFFDGYFWHGCKMHSSRPKTNTEFWDRKLDRNISRDLEQTESLERSGWEVLRYWEHSINADPESVAHEIMAALALRRNVL